MKIRFKLIILLLVISILPVIFISQLIFSNAEDIILEQTKNKLDLDADLKISFINGRLDNFEERLTAIQGSVNIRENFLILINSEDRNSQIYLSAIEELDQQLNPWIVASPELIDFMLISLDNKIIYSANIFHKERDLDASLPDPTGKSFEEGKKQIYFSNIFKNPFEEEEFEMLIVMPIYDDSEKIIGIIALEIAVTTLHQVLVERTELGESGESYLVGPNSIMLSPSRFQEDVVLNQEVDTLNVRNCFSSLQEEKLHLEVAFPDYRGVPVFGTSRYISRTNWCLLSEIDEAEAFEQVNILKKITLIFTGIALILIILISVFVTRRFLKPVQELTNIVDRISAGEINTKIDPGLIKMKDEIGTFARSFNVMQEKIMKSRKNLEAKVHERTKDLEAEKLETEKKAKRLADMKTATINILKDVEESRQKLIKSEGEIKLARGQLEIRVKERTKELLVTNQRLQDEILKTMKAKEIEKMKDELISLASHELRTPLTSISSLTELILNEKVGPINEKQKENLKVVVDDTRRLDALIRGILDVSRIEAGRIKYEFSEFDLSSLINESIKTSEAMAKEREISIEFESKGVKGIVNADKLRIGQVIINLITNAIKYGKKKGHIWISLSKKADDMIIAIKDDGIGIDEKDIPKLFTKMYQVGKGSERITGGIGFGLYISKRLVEEGHNGKIWVESTFGKGSTFYVSLPIKGKPPVPVKLEERNKMKKGSIPEDEMEKKVLKRMNTIKFEDRKERVKREKEIKDE